MRHTEIERLLPTVYQQVLQPESPLAAILSLMEVLHAPVEKAMQGLDSFIDPRRAPESFVPFLAGWVDFAWLLLEARTPAAARSGPKAARSLASGAGSTSAGYLLTHGLGNLRELIADAAWLSRQRGTLSGLTRFLEVGTGVEGFEIEERVYDEDNGPRPFHIRILVPEEADSPRYRALITLIVEMEKPASVTYELGNSS